MTTSRIAANSPSWMFAIVVSSLGLCDMAYADDSQTCQRWLNRVVQSPNHYQAPKDVQRIEPTPEVLAEATIAFSSDPWRVALLTETERLEAIQCLLGVENDTRAASMGGATRPVVSQLFGETPVNLAALYAISYIYTGRYDHADAIALQGDDASSTDSHGLYVTKASAIHRAYWAYRAWFARVRQIGLARARQLGLRPLDGTGLDWY
jgi:hypothetical protein